MVSSRLCHSSRIWLEDHAHLARREISIIPHNKWHTHTNKVLGTSQRYLSRFMCHILFVSVMTTTNQADECNTQFERTQFAYFQRTVIDNWCRIYRIKHNRHGIRNCWIFAVFLLLLLLWREIWMINLWVGSVDSSHVCVCRLSYHWKTIITINYTNNNISVCTVHGSLLML